jgi:16S rRNA (cytosine967-C5)-methyltransferase
MDLCAAPGGKTFHVQRLWPVQYAVVAMDWSLPRLRLLKQTAKRIEAGALPVVLADGMAPPFREGCLGAVLLDGPCSGTGVLRRHPEGRWRLQAGDLQRFGRRLLALAQQASALLVPGGGLLYATCSLEREENEEVVEALLKADATLEPDPGLSGSSAGRPWRSWLPHETGTDGFFAAVLRKKAVLN